MNITAILGSPHGIKGSSSALASWLLYEAELSGARIQGISLSDCGLEPCLGCDKCVGANDCPLNDDFQRVLDLTAGADGIVLISPMHFFSCSSYMKTFIDRCRGLLLRQSWKGKYGAVVMTSGDTDCHNASKHLLAFLRAAGCWTVGIVHARTSSWNDELEMEGSFHAARVLGYRLVEAIRNHEAFEDQQVVVDAYRDHLCCMAAVPLSQSHGRLHEWDRWEKQFRTR